MGGMDDARRARGRHRARPARPARRVRELPSSRAHREDGRDRRRDLGRALRARARRRLGRDRALDLRASRRAPRVALRRVLRDRPPPARGRARDVRGPVLERGRCGAAARAGAAGAADGRLDRPADARPHAAARGLVEHVVHVVWQHRRRLRGAEREDRRGLRGGWTRACARFSAAPPSSSSSTRRPSSGRTTPRRCRLPRTTWRTRFATSRRPAPTRQSSSCGRSPRPRSASSARFSRAIRPLGRRGPPAPARRRPPSAAAHPS